MRSLIARNKSLANELIQWGRSGEIRTHPLHYVSDMLFEGTHQPGREADLLEALIAGGADVDYQAKNGETALIGAASLLAERVGLLLLNHGAQPDMTGSFGETALPWAARSGLRQIVEGLIGGGADLNRRDARFNATPL